MAYSVTANAIAVLLIAAAAAAGAAGASSVVNKTIPVADGGVIDCVDILQQPAVLKHGRGIQVPQALSISFIKFCGLQYI